MLVANVGAQLNVRIPADLLNECRRRATVEDRSLRSLVEAALMDYCFGAGHFPTTLKAVRLAGSKCDHPITRRIGRHCALCGEAIK